jgi:hypothetical protein
MRRRVAGRNGHQLDVCGRGRELVQVQQTADRIGRVQRELGVATIDDFDVIQPKRQICSGQLPQPAPQQSAATLQRRQCFFLRYVRTQAANFLAGAGCRLGQRK